MSTPAVQIAFNYNNLDPATRQFVEERAERIHNLARMTATSIVQIGQYLTEVKERIGHGGFLEWIKAEFAWGERTARNFMMVHERFKTANFADLDIDVSALYLIAAPSMPEPVRGEAMRRAEGGEHITHTGVRALVQRFAETGELPVVEQSLPQLIKERVALRREAAQQPPLNPPAREQRLTAAEKQELEEQRERARANAPHISAWMSIVRAVETLAAPQLPMQVVAKEIRRFDAPNKDWHGKARTAYRTLAALLKELDRDDG